MTARPPHRPAPPRGPGIGSHPVAPPPPTTGARGASPLGPNPEVRLAGAASADRGRRVTTASVANERGRRPRLEGSPARRRAGAGRRAAGRAQGEGGHCWSSAAEWRTLRRRRGARGCGESPSRRGAHGQDHQPAGECARGRDHRPVTAPRAAAAWARRSSAAQDSEGRAASHLGPGTGAEEGRGRCGDPSAPEGSRRP